MGFFLDRVQNSLLHWDCVVKLNLNRAVNGFDMQFACCTCRHVHGTYVLRCRHVHVHVHNTFAGMFMHGTFTCYGCRHVHGTLRNVEAGMYMIHLAVSAGMYIYMVHAHGTCPCCPHSVGGWVKLAWSILLKFSIWFYARRTKSIYNCRPILSMMHSYKSMTCRQSLEIA